MRQNKIRLNTVTLSLVFLGIIYSIVYNQGWQPQIPPRTDRNLFDIWFVNESIGCACGNFGFLIRTTDAGINWQDRSGITNAWLDDMWFIAHIGYAVGEAGTVLKTTDAGASWFVINTGSNRNFYGVCFPDTNNGWITGQGGIIYHTSDGGITWYPQNPGTTLYIFDIEFVNPDTGWACGQNGWVYKTSNGGNNWTRLNISGSDLYGLKCARGSELWVAGANGKIHGISDFGNNVRSWQVGSGTLKAVEVKGNRIWVCGQFGTVVYSPNSGDTWIQQNSQTTNYLDEIFFWDGTRGWTVGMQGTIRYTENGGVGLPETSNNQDNRWFWISPNPIANKLKFYLGNHLPNSNQLVIKFWSITGKLVRQFKLRLNGSKTYDLAISDMPNGIYLVTVDGAFSNPARRIKIIRL